MSKDYLSRQEKEELASMLYRHLKQQRPDLTEKQISKVGSTFYTLFKAGRGEKTPTEEN